MLAVRGSGFGVRGSGLGVRGSGLRDRGAPLKDRLADGTDCGRSPVTLNPKPFTVRYLNPKLFTVREGFRVQGFGFRVQGSGFRVQGLGLRAQGLGVGATEVPHSRIDWLMARTAEWCVKSSIWAGLRA